MKKFRVHMKVHCGGDWKFSHVSCDIGSVLREAGNIDEAVTSALMYAADKGFPDAGVWNVELEEGGL